MRYQCSECKEVRFISVQLSHTNPNSPKDANGLVIYSDIHRCRNGVLGINNLHIDRNYAIRSFDVLELDLLASKNSKVKSFIPAPNIKKDQNKINKYLITDLIENRSIRFTLQNYPQNYIFNIGHVGSKDEEPLLIVYSKNRSISLEVFQGNIKLTQTSELWLHNLVNLIEQHQPNHLGICIEAFRYIIDVHRTDVNEFYLNILSTIISSQNCFLLPVSSIPPSNEELLESYGEDEIIIYKLLIQMIYTASEITIHYILSQFEIDVPYLLHMITNLIEDKYIIQSKSSSIIEANTEKKIFEFS
ncbi:MAG: hypothetical protein OEZ01_16285 [Candidatus Heimdallarchaeota archaeon]|nr:hypothetical protein [Candidatus Heimdallarchaeota archaeon]